MSKNRKRKQRKIEKDDKSLIVIGRIEGMLDWEQLLELLQY